MDALTRWDPSRWDPFKGMEDISERFNRIFGRLPARRESGREAMTVADVRPVLRTSGGHDGREH